MSLPPIPAQRGTDGLDPVCGPAPHEDLTIGEILETMRVPSRDRPGEQCFLTEKGEHHWIPDDQVASFTAASGALHPSDYQVANGISWELRFFSGF